MPNDAVRITTTTGNFYTRGTIEDVRRKLDGSEPIECFWFTEWGRKYTETFIFAADAWKCVATESDIRW